MQTRNSGVETKSDLKSTFASRSSQQIEGLIAGCRIHSGEIMGSWDFRDMNQEDVLTGGKGTQVQKRRCSHWSRVCTTL